MYNEMLELTKKFIATQTDPIKELTIKGRLLLVTFEIDSPDSIVTYTKEYNYTNLIQLVK